VPSDRILSKFNSAFTENRIEEKGTNRMKRKWRRKATDKDMNKPHFSFKFKRSFFLSDNLKVNVHFSLHNLSFLWLTGNSEIQKIAGDLTTVHRPVAYWGLKEIYRWWPTVFRLFREIAKSYYELHYVCINILDKFVTIQRDGLCQIRHVCLSVRS